MYSVNGNCFRISVRNLVEFMCAEGDIDNRNTGSNDVKIMQEGAKDSQENPAQHGNYVSCRSAFKD